MLDQTFTKLMLLVIISSWRGRPEWRSCPVRRSFGNTPSVFHHLSLEPESPPRAKSNLQPCQKWQFQLHKHWLQRWKIRLIIHASFFFSFVFSGFPIELLSYPLHLFLYNSFMVWVCLHLKKWKTVGKIWCHMSKINISLMFFNQKG